MKAVKLSRVVWKSLWRELPSANCVINGEFLKKNTKCVGTDSVAQSCVTSLKVLGILDQDCRLSGLGFRWVDAKKHGDACVDLYRDFFPAKLRLLFAGNENVRRADVARWLMENEGLPVDAANKTASFFSVLRDEVNEYELENDGSDEAKSHKNLQGSSGESPSKSEDATFTISVVVKGSDIPRVAQAVRNAVRDIVITVA